MASLEGRRTGGKTFTVSATAKTSTRWTRWSVTFLERLPSDGGGGLVETEGFLLTPEFRGEGRKQLTLVPGPSETRRAVGMDLSHTRGEEKPKDGEEMTRRHNGDDDDGF